MEGCQGKIAAEDGAGEGFDGEVAQSALGDDGGRDGGARKICGRELEGRMEKSTAE